MKSSHSFDFFSSGYDQISIFWVSVIVLRIRLSDKLVHISLAAKVAVPKDLEHMHAISSSPKQKDLNMQSYGNGMFWKRIRAKQASISLDDSAKEV